MRDARNYAEDGAARFWLFGGIMEHALPDSDSPPILAAPLVTIGLTLALVIVTALLGH